MKYKKLLPGILCIFLITCSVQVKAQTTLAAGDIMITCINTDGTDNFTFVLLKPISSGTSISFSDIGYDPGVANWGGTTGISEMYFTWTSGSAMACGTEVTITAGAPTTASTGTISGITGGPSLNLSTAGESVLAFQGTFASPTFITGVDTQTGGWSWNVASPISTCGLPSSLTNGTNAVAFTNIDNWKYNCTTTTGSASVLRAALANTANWLSDDAVPYATPPGCITSCTSLAASTSQTNASCYGSSTGSAIVSPSGGTAPYTYSWSPSGGTGATASNLVAGTYNCTITDATSTSIVKSFTITQPSNTPGSNSYTLPTSNQTLTQTVSAQNYVSNTCQQISGVTASGASPVSGNITHKVWIEGSVPKQAGKPFVQRHYEITPASNAATATGTVTLYFTQAEFTNFNNDPTSALDLPTGAADATGKSNLRIGKYAGTSSNGSGLPATYGNSTQVIDPDDNNIVWNSTSSTWEVTFTVSGFSGFIVQTNATTLPLSFTSFSVQKQNGLHLIRWSTVVEQQTRDFTVEHKTETGNWQSLGVVPAKGNTGGEQQYSFLNQHPVGGVQYYRIRQTDLDGQYTYSVIQKLTAGGNRAAFTVLNNPVRNGQLEVQVSESSSLQLYSADGKLLWQKTVSPGKLQIPIQQYAGKMFFLKSGDTIEKIALQ